MKITKKIPKTRAKKFKKLKNIFPALFLAKTGCDKLKKREKTFSLKIPFILDPRKKILKKIPKKIAKKFKKLKSLFLALFLAKSGFGWMKKGEKTFCAKFRSYPTRR